MEILQNEYVSIGLVILLAVSEALGGIERFKANTVLGLIKGILSLFKKESKKLMLMLLLVAMVGCVSSNMTRKENLENNLQNAELVLALADSMVRTERINVRYQEDIDEVKQIIKDVRLLSDTGEEALAIKTWQDGVKILILLNEKIYEAEQRE